MVYHIEETSFIIDDGKNKRQIGYALMDDEDKCVIIAYGESNIKAIKLLLEK